MKKRTLLLVVAILLSMSTSAFAVGPITSGDKFYYESSPLFYDGRKILLDDKNGEKAMITFKKAVEEGDGRAAMWIGVMYAQAECGIPESPKNAIDKFQKLLEVLTIP